ncbi:helix-turn-helix transcriptional regulator [Streptomyces albireticuli]|uniref:Transcriptional regulator n=1 Tax=Streptomyces albireticuli TaxID=1940 RepID=A0A2A2D470_9ACTN|nr:helix-turn-helix transcriptional regulator [Streptomyces albireticuli]MCD9140495.1 helix-turn-helix transcriptional regulator [Streptomyces albireticuli]MCD9161543.1 helix-turn-helix transcriptional regulator [Streptomyces albireticuli]MCD9192887.1 helix-turn-helix transcriptional regulator [Streptomyces albireticuli]PAU46226.1 transcriptional regulator [Streptomyces albireticuli]
MTTVAVATGVGALLREWRERRRVSQLELALRADSSARHISFIETGRARPSQEMVLRLADRLDVPVRDQNALLLAAGYAPRFPERPLDDPALTGLREGLDALLRGHEPYPALIVDGAYDVVAANRGIGTLLQGVAEPLLEAPLNAMRVTLHPQGLAPRILNFREWRGHLLHQMERQLALVRSAPLRALYEEVSAYPLPDGAAAGPPDDTVRAPYALPMVVEHDGRTLSFVSTITTFNTPMDVTVSELAMETFLPADPETARHLRERQLLTP